MGVAIDRIAASRQPKPEREPEFTHGTVYGYRCGCQCVDCKEASASARRRCRANAKLRKESF